MNTLNQNHYSPGDSWELAHLNCTGPIYTKVRNLRPYVSTHQIKQQWYNIEKCVHDVGWVSTLFY